MDLGFKSYLVRAAYEYCIDHGQVPMLTAAVGGSSSFPLKYASGRTITFDLSNNAVRELVIEEDCVSFSTRFEGKIEHVKLEMEEIAWVGSKTGSCSLGFKVTVKPKTAAPASQELASTDDTAQSRPSLRLI